VAIRAACDLGDVARDSLIGAAAEVVYGVELRGHRWSQFDQQCWSFVNPREGPGPADGPPGYLSDWPG
jgi:hypothetical protein